MGVKSGRKEKAKKGISIEYNHYRNNFIWIFKKIFVKFIKHGKGMFNVILNKFYFNIFTCICQHNDFFYYD